MDATVQVQQVSEPYVNEFTRLENNHGWAKAELLARWRRETKATDDEIAAAIGGGCHAKTVNRMRRVWEDFGVERSLYRNLSFSHFLEALAWDDSEAWLKDANGKGWSVAEMRERHQEKGTAPHPPARSSKPESKPESEEDEDDADDTEEIPEEDEGEVRTAVEPNPARKKTLDKPKPTDLIGQPIPVHLRDIFETSRLLLTAESDLQKVAEEITATATDDIGDKNPIVGNRIKVIQNHIENAKREIRFCAPHVVCPVCKGSGCSGCRMKGWMDKDTWNAIKGS
jgi:hypothetical protein